MDTASIIVLSAGIVAFAALLVLAPKIIEEMKNRILRDLEFRIKNENRK